MPFTFSHPAIILPFLRTRSRAISMSALVVGSMTPDFQYFLSMKLNGRFSHTLPGVFLFDIPVAVCIWIVFHTLVKKPLIDNLPAAISSRLQRLKAFDFLTYLKSYSVGLLLCFFAGIVSHILWDGFTHHDGVLVPFIPVLDSVVEVRRLPELPLFRYLQHISTLVGAVCMLYAFVKIPRESVSSGPGLKFWVILFALAVPAYLIRSYFGIEYYGDLIVVIISSFFIGLLLASAVMHIRPNKT